MESRKQDGTTPRPVAIAPFCGLAKRRNTSSVLLLKENDEIYGWFVAALAFARFAAQARSKAALQAGVIFLFFLGF